MSSLLTYSSAVNPLTETLRQALDAFPAHSALLDHGVTASLEAPPD